MSSDIALVIPHLSKELNLIGHPALPYTLEKTFKKKHKTRGDEDEYKIVFDSKVMLTSLTSICFELVKQIKVLGVDENSTLDKLNFEITKLEKKLKSSTSEIEKHISKITSITFENQQLQEKIDNLEKKIKDYKISQQTLVQKNQSNEDKLKHVLKKSEAEVFDLHKIVWKQFNLADQNYFPENFKLVELNQPNFSKLWSTVKHSEPKTREDALKKAVCIFQDNNKFLMEENFSLKTLLSATLRETHDTVKDFASRLHLPQSVLSELKVSDLFTNIEEFDVSVYNKILNKHLTVIKRVCELFDKAMFTLDDDIFVSWSKIIEDF